MGSSHSVQFSSVHSLSHGPLIATPWIAARQASLSITNSQSSPKLMSIESVMPFSHLILCCPLLLLPPIPPSIRPFPVSQLCAWGGQSTGVSALASFLPNKSQGWSPSGWTGWSSHTRNQAHISCFCKWILYHWATREATICVPSPPPIFKLCHLLFIFEF